jgi:hypothetical protein
MPKVVSLASHTGTMAQFLSRHGYKIVDHQWAGRPGVHIDAILYTSYRPDMMSSCTSFTETADISLGNISHDPDSYCPAVVNITGMGPDAVLDLLKRRLFAHAGSQT